MKTWIFRLGVPLAILGIAGTVSFRFFANARENARTSSCQSQLKEIALSFKQYSADYDDKFPLAVVNAHPDEEPPYAVPYGWADAIQPYQKGVCVFQCPSGKSAAQ